MGTAIRVLIVEDSTADAELIAHELRRSGFEPDWERVDGEGDYLARLQGGYEVILADYTLPQFDALRALRLLQESGLDIPFIVVTGIVGEEAAVACMLEGAADYLLKDRLARLGPAVERALAQKRLRDEKKQAAEELARARDDAEAANRAKSNFLADISHEIRTPLSGLQGLAELLLDTELTEVQRKYIQQIHASSENLLDLLNDLLDLSKIESGRLELEQLEFDMATVTESAVTLLGPSAADKSLKLLCHCSAEVPRVLIGDPLRLLEVLLNLMSNAIKFTQEGEVELRVGLVRRTTEGAELLFAVRDTGIGIPAEKLGVIFKPYIQAEGATARKYGGTGLGLTISRRLVEMLDGRIWVESEPGQGSTFQFTAFFRLPARSPRAGLAPTLTAAGPPSGQGSAPRRILLAEDDPIHQEVIARMLEKRGWEVTVVDDGRAALACSAEMPFDLILMDVRMSVLDGLDATTAIRAQEQVTGRRVPIVALTAGATRADWERYLAAGMDGVLIKPVKASDLSALDDLYSNLKPVSLDESPPRPPANGKPVILDLAEAMDHCDNDPKILGRVARLFQERFPSRLAELDSALAADDAHRLGTQAHGLKGVAGTLGAMEMAELAQKLEEVSLSGELTRAPALIQALGESMSRLQNRLAEEKLF